MPRNGVRPFLADHDVFGRPVGRVADLGPSRLSATIWPGYGRVVVVGPNRRDVAVQAATHPPRRLPWEITQHAGATRQTPDPTPLYLPAQRVRDILARPSLGDVPATSETRDQVGDVQDRSGFTQREQEERPQQVAGHQHRVSLARGLRRASGRGRGHGRQDGRPRPVRSGAVHRCCRCEARRTHPATTRRPAWCTLRSGAVPDPGSCRGMPGRCGHFLA